MKYDKEKLKGQTDSIVKLELMSLIAIEPARWKAFCSRLGEAGGKLIVVLSNISTNPTINFSSEQLRQLIKEEEQKKTGLDYFVNNKRLEVLDYARKHFRNVCLLLLVVVDANEQEVVDIYDRRQTAVGRLSMLSMNISTDGRKERFSLS